MDSSQNCHCQCGKTTFNVSGTPVMRFFCHCTLCQEFNQSPYADITIFRARDVVPPQENSIELMAYRFPPVLQRGICVSCGKPAIEYLKIFPMPEFVLVPTANIEDREIVPEPSLHIFYDTRAADIQDELPKYSGYMMSQLAMGKRLMASLLHAGT